MSVLLIFRVSCLCLWSCLYSVFLRLCFQSMLPTGTGRHGGGLTMELLGHTAFSFTFMSCLALETMIGSTKTKINWNFLEEVCAWVSGGRVLQYCRCVCVCAQWVSVPMCGLQVYRVLLWVCESVFRLHTKLSWIRENQLERQLWRDRDGERDDKEMKEN